MRLREISPPGVLSVWPHARQYVMEAVRYEDPEYSELDIVNFLMSGVLTLFVMEGEKIAGAVVVSIHEYPMTKRCRIRWCGGEDMDDWIALIADVETWAAQQGCSSVRISGRKGWERVLPDYAHAGVILVKRLDNENAH